jgi:predicted phosphohydrolase
VIFAMSDLHLSFSANKSMDVFGEKWENYVEKISENWQKTVKNDDLVLVAGDISWAETLEDAYEDLKFLNSLNGTKVLIKGNHDYWWKTKAKLQKFAKDAGFATLNFLKNDYFKWGNYYVCGTKGYQFPESGGEFDDHDAKILEREKIRLEISLKSAKNAIKSQNSSAEIITMTHYPPTDGMQKNMDFLNIMKNYDVKYCIYGHLHETSYKYAIEGDVSGVSLKLTSCDYLNFLPYKLV